MQKRVTVQSRATSDISMLMESSSYGQICKFSRFGTIAEGNSHVPNPLLFSGLVDHVSSNKNGHPTAFSQIIY